MILARKIPARSAAKPKRMLKEMFMSALKFSPSLIRFAVSSIKVEKVV
jgi:hypothetical protein